MNSFWNDVNPQSVSQAPDSFTEFEVGDNVARITKVEDGSSKNGNDMIIITFENDEGARIRHYITEGKYKLTNLKQLYQAFNIPVGTTNTQHWINKRGIVVCKKGEEYDGKTYNKVSYVRPLDGAKPPEQQPARPPAPPPVNQAPPSVNQPTPPSDDGFTEDIPF